MPGVWNCLASQVTLFFPLFSAVIIFVPPCDRQEHHTNSDLTGSEFSRNLMFLDIVYEIQHIKTIPFFVCKVVCFLCFLA